uniref:Ig-like domain-containing protein n=1 Tax=Bos mutus grunniens TaxID=30521 RepID=A0A8B9WNV6_BOSMU
MRAPALLLVVLAPVMQVSSDLMLITSKTGETASFPCDLTQGATYIHLYKHEEGTAPRRLLYYDSYNSKAVLESGISETKYHVYKGTGRRYTFAILNLQASDSGIYYCAIWDNSSGWRKIFGEGANIIVTPPERNLEADTSPKPTVFLPSIAEINHDNAGTYLCLLEKFFPDVITVSWRAKNDKRALPSQQGNTMKTKDTYMKFSWLTVTENSMDKQHVCVVKHKKNIGGIDQEIIFPSIKEVVTSLVPTTEPPTTKPPTTKPPTTEPPTTEPPNDCLTDESKVTGTGSKKACLKNESDTNSTKACLEGTLQLQLMNTSAAYYTYLLLLFLSTVYFVVIISCVFRRTGVC